VPERDKRAGKAVPADQKTRAERITANGGRPSMPDVGEAQYLIGYWQRVGMVAAGGMGPAPLPPSEILAWQTGTGTPLLPWEFTAIQEMSRAYVSESHAAQRADAQPPYGAPEFDREVVARKVANAFSALARSRNQP